MKLSEIKGEQALDVVAEIIDPITELALDAELRGKPKIVMIKQALKSHKDAIISILAALDLKSVEEYKESMNLLTLPQQLMDIFNDPEVELLFGSQSQTDKTSFGSAMENTEAQEA